MIDSPKWSHKAAVAWVEGAGERVVVLDLDCTNGPPIILTDSAAVIWLLLAEPRPERSVVQAVAEHYRVSADDVGGPVRDYLADLSTRGLIERNAP